MGLRSFAKRLSTPVADLDAEKLQAFCAEHGVSVAISDLTPRTEVTVVGEEGVIRGGVGRTASRQSGLERMLANT